MRTQLEHEQPSAITIAKNTLRYKINLRGTSGCVSGQRWAGAHPAGEPWRGQGPQHVPRPCTLATTCRSQAAIANFDRQNI